MNRTEILSGKAGLAGIQWALQGRLARSQLRAELDRMLQPGCHSGPLQLTRAKYKLNRHLLAYYSFDVDEPKSGKARKASLAVTWRQPTDGTAKDTSAGEVQRTQMEDEARQRNLLSPFTTLSSEITDWGIALQVWPLDEEFPHLVRLSDPTYAPHLFQSSGIPLPVELHDCVNVVPIRYRPGERHVLQYQVIAPTLAVKPDQRLYAKLYKDSAAAERAYGIANRVSAWLAANLANFQGIKPVGVSAEDSVILYPHASGIPLSRQLHRSPGWLKQQLNLVGAALATLHRGPAALSADLEETSLEREIKVIARASEHIQTLLPDTGSLILRALDNAQRLYDLLPQEAPTFTHSDFKADHLLIDSTRMALIDFDTCALADPALDIGKFLADLDWWYYLTHTNGIEQAQQEFINGYGSGAENGRLARAQIYHSLILMKIAIRRTRLYWKNWETVTTQMVQRAEGILKNLNGR